MSKPARGLPRPADDRTDPEPSRDEIAIINERDRDYSPGVNNVGGSRAA